MSPKPEPLNTSGSTVEREQHHPISHSSIQSLPIPAATSSIRFGASLPALQDPRYVPLIFHSFTHTFVMPSPVFAQSSLVGVHHATCLPIS